MKTIEWLQEVLKEHFNKEATGHDYWHAMRVYKSACHLGQLEGADMRIVSAAALIHDVVDSKLSAEKRESGYILIEEWLKAMSYTEEEMGAVLYIIDNMSYKGGTNNHIKLPLEGRVVQDADRLDALGAIGIARTFAFGGAKGRAIHNPDEQAMTFEDYETFKGYEGTSINHFYEKLLKLKKLMNTDTGTKVAEARHRYMEEFLDQFYGEWHGEK